MRNLILIVSVLLLSLHASAQAWFCSYPDHPDSGVRIELMPEWGQGEALWTDVYQGNDINVFRTRYASPCETLLGQAPYRFDGNVGGAHLTFKHYLLHDNEMDFWGRLEKGTPGAFAILECRSIETGGELE